MRRRFGIGLAIAVILGACTGGGGGVGGGVPSAVPSPAPTAAAAAKCPPTNVKIAVPVTPPNVVHLPPFVAQELGYFTDENLKVELVRFEGGVGALRAMVAGGVNLAGTSTEPVITAVAQGVPVKIVNTYSPNISQVFAVRDTIKSAADLRGKKIGIQEPGGFADALSRAYLQKSGIDAKDVQFVTTTTAARVQQLVAGGTDTAILHVDQVLAVKKTAPNIAVLANMWEVLTDYQYAVYAVPSAEAKSATTECMLRAIIRANRAMYDPSLRARILDMAVRETKAERDVVEAAYKTLESGKAWPQNEGIPQKNVEGTVKSLLDLKQIDRPISFADAVDLALSAKIVAQLGKKDWPY